MTRRDRRWELVGLESDPVPGDERDVLAVESTYRKRGQALETTRSALSKLSDLDGWSGKAAVKFADQADDILEEVGKAERKYERAASALRDYADAVATARTRTEMAVSDAEDAERRRATNAENPLAGVDDLSDEQKDADDDRRRRLDRADGDLAAARAAMSRALDDLDAAANRAASRIDSASKSYKDSHLDNFKGEIRKHAGLLNKIVDVLEKIAIAVAVIVVVALVVVAVVATGGAAAVIFGAVATYAGYAAVASSALLLAGHSAQMMGETSDASWGDIGMDIVGLATFGAGGALLKGAQKSLKMAKAAQLSRMTRAAKLTLPKKAITSLRPGARYNKWANRLLDEARGPGDQALKGLGGATADKPTRLLHLNNGLSDTLAQLDVVRKVAPEGAALENFRRAESQIHRAVVANTMGNVSNLDQVSNAEVGKNSIDFVVKGGHSVGHHLSTTGP
ncbi:putative T7SS-secreted protein [Aeromicrobium fastidiosum]|uniref:Putative T7SS secretion signal domain-containing protein n=1 Tax=Aeromicrobium fastidiosum TaxID=52699 RepID=A0A641ARD0_9ACTN|nr:hypothetical protein [Aeromicrobium fastidiosum]KAA1380505.1 hypothetical protein ESP62_004825 [Aeromicrobium fastidiosum]MBP2390095.1 uncharacterized protein YukE [Aeromicrobium fastidiosum]